LAPVGALGVHASDDGDAVDEDDGRGRFLDAFATVVRRHGLSKARVRDVADELGVSRVTVYRQVGTVPEMTALLLQREVSRVLPDPTAWVEAKKPVDALIAVLAEVAAVLRSHPVLDKVIRDEPHLLGEYLVRDLPRVLNESRTIGASLFEDAIGRGILARRDPAHLADWVGRVLLTAVIAPPAQPLDEFFDAGLRPLLEPPTATKRRRT
jgi:AcrR family transcriptional regulator